MTFKPTLCLDFDGVIHSYRQPWINAQTIPDEPVEDAFGFIERALATGFHVAVHSSRSHQPGGIEAMKAWMASHGAGPLASKIEWPGHKPSAFLTIDDRAITFDGTWPDVASLKRFKPWNK